MSSNSLYDGLQRWGPYRCQVLPVPVGGPPCAACVLQAVGGSLNGLAHLISDKNAH